MSNAGGDPKARRPPRSQGGHTPIDPDAAAFLTPEHADLQTLNELNEAEAINILDAYEWLHGQNLEPTAILNQSFLLELHRRMFCNVWTWAGHVRQRGTNLGVDPAHIREQWQILLGDTLYWIEHQTYPPVEVGVRFHHQSVSIHPFTNGNGRHARLSAATLAQSLGLGDEVYTWGRSAGADVTTARAAYLDALRAADRGDYSSLVAVATS